MFSVVPHHLMISDRQFAMCIWVVFLDFIVHFLHEEMIHNYTDRWTSSYMLNLILEVIRFLLTI